MSLEPKQSRGPSRRERRRLALFDAYARQLQQLSNVGRPVFMCPLCPDGGELFTRDDCIGRNSRLTLAHVLPSATGHQITTLACKECNNRSGTRLEAAQVDHARFHSFSAGEESRDVILRAGNQTVHGSLAVHGTNLSFEVQSWRSNPSRVDAFRAALERPAPGASIQFSISVAAEGRLHHSLLVGGVLGAFWQFGYELVRHPDWGYVHAFVRRGISGTTSDHDLTHLFATVSPWEWGPRLVWVAMDRDCECLGVVLPWSRHRPAVMVLLPSPRRSRQCAFEAALDTIKGSSAHPMGFIVMHDPTKGFE